jgi:murein DD-endopeptidase MepM/ murein hydrolase activator NlpD
MATKPVTVQTFHPAKPSRISDKFGTHGETRKKLGLGPHRGLDYSVQTGTDLIAIGTGRVKNIGETKVLGHFIEISCPVIVDGKLEVKIFGYYHLATDQNLAYKIGDPIKGGQILCKSGNTGSASSGPHLHLMAGDKINLATNPVEDPLALIEATLTPQTIQVAVKEETVAETKPATAAKKPATKKPPTK